jgi:hypothetical protein
MPVTIQFSVVKILLDKYPIVCYSDSVSIYWKQCGSKELLLGTSSSHL